MAKACLFVACLVLLLPAYLAQAADDDLTSSAYLVFDPETGEFITVQDPDRSKQNHAARDPANVASNHAPTAGNAGNQASPTAAGAAMAIALLGVAAWLQLRKGKPG